MENKEIENNEIDEVEVLGLCPECGEQVLEDSKAYGCSGWRDGCKFTIWKNDRFLASMKKEPTKEMVISLLSDGECLVEGLTSKKGNVFDAFLSYGKDNKSGYYSWSMRFPERE